MARTRLYPPSVDPGFPELPPTPKGWRRTTFRDVLDVVERPVKLEPDRTYLLLTAKRSRGGIELRGEMLGKEILTKTQFEAKGGDFLVSRRQIIHGACGVVPDTLDGAVISNEYSTLRPRRDLLLDFFRYYSHTSYFQRTCFHSSHGVDVEKMIFKIDEWLQRPIDLPPLSEQRKIVAILSSIGESVEATQAVIAQLQVVRKTLAAELLTLGIPGTRARFKMTEVGNIRENWRVVGLLDVARLPTGQVDPRVVENARLPLIAPNHIESGTGRLLAIETAEAQGAISGKYQVRPGDVVYCKIRPYLKKAWLADRVGLCSADMYPMAACEQMLPEFLLLVVLGDRFVEFATSVSARTGIPKINREELSQYKLALPPLDEQRVIADCVTSVMERERAEHEVLNSLLFAQNALVSALLTGEVRVTP